MENSVAEVFASPPPQPAYVSYHATHNDFSPRFSPTLPGCRARADFWCRRFTRGGRAREPFVEYEHRARTLAEQSEASPDWFRADRPLATVSESSWVLPV